MTGVNNGFNNEMKKIFPSKKVYTKLTKLEEVLYLRQEQLKREDSTDLQNRILTLEYHLKVATKVDEGGCSSTTCPSCWAYLEIGEMGECLNCGVSLD